MRNSVSKGHSAKLKGVVVRTLNRDDLPEYADNRWVQRRKAQVVAGVRGGILSLHEALERYNLSLEQFIEWEREVGAELAERRRTGRMRELMTLGDATGRRWREGMTNKREPSFDALDRVALLRDRGGLKRGMVGTVTKRQTLRGDLSVSPDPSGHIVFVIFDNVIGMIPTPVDELKRSKVEHKALRQDASLRARS
jgi:hypothetical protein